jgi:hypothetical protein
MIRWMCRPNYLADYSLTLPDGFPEERYLVAVWRGDSGPSHECLLGPEALVEFTEHAPTEWQLQCRITLSAADRTLAAVGSISFSVDRALVRMLRPGDVLNIKHDSQDGVGISAVRRDHLLWAVGNIAGMPLGTEVGAWIPGELTTKAEAVFRTVDPEYEAFEHPIQFTIGGTTRILHWGRPTVNGYEIYVRRGYGGEGKPCVSIANTAVCPDSAASISALLLARESPDIKPWAPDS